MANVLPFQNQCCLPCDEATVVNVPGATGLAGADGADGADGVNAYTTLTALFVMPAMLGTVTADVVDSSWMAIGQMLYVQNAGYMSVQAKPTNLSVTLRNEETVGGAYDSNVAPGTNIPFGSYVSPAGIQGQTGAAGADGGSVLAFRTIVAAGPDTVLVTDQMILVVAPGAVTLAMTTAVGRTGESVIVKRDMTMAFPVNINGSGGETIDGAAGIVIMHPGESVTMISDGTNWFLI